MDVLSLDRLADPAELHVFIDALSDMAGTSASAALTAMAVVLERNLRRASDDTEEAYRVGRVLRAVRAELERRSGGGDGPPAEPSAGHHPG